MNLAGGAVVAGGTISAESLFGAARANASACAGPLCLKAVDGGTTRVSRAQLARFSRNVQGDVFDAGAPEYEASRKIWNARVNHYPGMIVRVADTADIVETINFTRANGIELSIRAGGHNHAGYAVSDRGIMLDLSALKATKLLPDEKRISAAPGLTFAEFDAITQQEGLATTGPIVSMVGLPGYTLGGGIGWLHRKFGAGCDNLLGAEVVLASGEVVRAGKDENSELLWALRGGGGNFGVVSRLDYQLHPLSNVLAGLIFFPLDDLDTVGSFVDEYLDAAPDDLNVWMLHRMAPPSPALPTEMHGRPVVILAVTWTGGAEGERIIAPLRAIMRPLADLVRWRSYTEWQGALDGAWGDGFCNEWVGGYFDRYDDDIRAAIANFTAKASSPFSDFKLARLGGAFSRRGEEESAFGFRNARYAYVIQTRWRASDDETRHMEWTRAFHAQMRTFDEGHVYANFIGKDEPQARFKDAYAPSTHQRLRRIKSAVDPQNMFRRNVNIKPL